jgi:hypothetical protein
VPCSAGGAETGLGMPALAHNLSLGDTFLTITPAAGFLIEAVLAFFLVTVVLATAVAGRAGKVAPLAIGMTLTFNIIMGGALTGASFNPARALGPMIATGNFTDAWLYLMAPIVGAIVAAIVHTSLTGSPKRAWRPWTAAKLSKRRPNDAPTDNQRIRSWALRNVLTDFVRLMRSSSDSEGSRTWSGPSRPTMLGSESVTPNFGL